MSKAAKAIRRYAEAHRGTDNCTLYHYGSCKREGNPILGSIISMNQEAIKFWDTRLSSRR